MSWMTRLVKTRVPVAMVLALTVCGGGCQPDDEGTVKHRAGEDFLRDDETSAVTRIAERQMAAGARTEATLRPYHFDNAGLNSLGREKLDFILADGDQGGDLVVYVDVAADGANRQHADARHAAVAEYLTAQGLAEGEFRLESGFNPHNTMSAASAAPKVDAEGEDAAGAADGGYGPMSDMIPAK